jgi:hypothetical protein
LLVQSHRPLKYRRHWFGDPTVPLGPFLRLCGLP